jgi:hypothetical protein
LYFIHFYANKEFNYLKIDGEKFTFFEKIIFKTRKFKEEERKKVESERKKNKIDSMRRSNVHDNLL